MPRKTDETVKIAVRGTYISVSTEQYKPIDAHFQPDVKVEIELPAVYFVRWDGKGKNKVAVLTPMGYFWVSELLRKAAQAALQESPRIHL